MMNPTIMLIVIIFAVFFVISIIVAVVMGIMQKKGTLDEKVQALSDAMGITPQDYSQKRYCPSQLGKYHIQRDEPDEEFGRAVEVIQGKKIKNLIMGIIWIAIGIVFFVMRTTIITDTSVPAGFIVGNIVMIVCAVGCIVYGFYRFSFLGREVVLYETGLTYKNALLQKERLPYADIIRISVGQEYARGAGSTNVPQQFGMKHYVYNLINFRTVFRLFTKEKTVTGESKTVEFWEIHYKYLPEKAEAFKEYMQSNT